MEKRKITVFVLCMFSLFSLYAEITKEGFTISGIRIDTPLQNETLLEEESYTINEDSLYHCVYKLRNASTKSNNMSFSINVTTAPWGGANYCETLLPEDFTVLVNNEKVHFTYKNEEAVLKGQDIFKRGMYEHGTTGDIIFSLEMKPNELKTLEISYTVSLASSIPSIVYEVYFAQNIRRSPDYKRKISVHNPMGEVFISRIVAFQDGNPPGYNRKTILDVYDNYIDSSEIVFERRDKEVVLNFTGSDSVRMVIHLSVFIEYNNPASDCKFHSGSIELYSVPRIVLSQIVIPKLNLYFLNNRQLWLLRNAFYAVHGYAFKDPELTEFFLENLKGYRDLMKQGFDEKSLNEIEWKNIELIRKMENMKEPVILSDWLE